MTISLVAHRGGAATGAVDHYLALTETTGGRFDQADRNFAAAALHESLGAPIWLARTRLEWAQLLLTRRAPGDAERAGELLDQALATSRELGLGAIEHRATVMLG